MSRILLRAQKDPFRVASAEETLSANLIGNNTGNLVFSQSVHRLLSTESQTITSDPLKTDLDAGRISAEYDRLVIPLANAFRPGYEKRLHGLADLIERLAIPVTVVGVGAQATLTGRHRASNVVDPAVTRFVRAVLNRGGPIGVRGEFTRDYLHGLGFADDEVSVIGCPSMFMYGPELQVKPKVKELAVDAPIGVTISPYVQQMGPISLTHAEHYPHLVYLAQNIQSLELLLTGTYPMRENAKMRTTGVPVSLRHPLVRDNRIRFFLDPTTWFSYLGDLHFTFGTRIHGTIATLLAGTPAVLLAHDARTRELADLHHIPCRNIGDLPPDVDAAELYAEADWSDFNEAQPAAWERFAGFLAGHDLDHAYADGRDRGYAFDARLAATKFPPPVGTLASADLETLYGLQAEVQQLRARSAPLHRLVARRLRHELRKRTPGRRKG